MKSSFIAVIVIIISISMLLLLENNKYLNTYLKSENIHSLIYM